LAFLICTDVNLDLQLLVQSYIQRWEIECNHRDEKSLLGVAQGQVRSPQAVSRLPQFQVAAYSLLLLASLLSSGFQRTTDYLPLPKWRRQAERPSLLDLLNLLRHQIFARGVAAPTVHFDDFASTSIPPAVKPSKLPWTRRRSPRSRPEFQWGGSLRPITVWNWPISRDRHSCLCVFLLFTGASCK